MRSRASLLLAALLLVPGALAHGPEVERDAAAELGLFPTHEEVADVVGRAAEHPWSTLHALASTTKGRPLVVLEITDPTSPVPREERVVTLLVTQQHGNEPAGTGAAVWLLEDFLAGKALKTELRNQVLLVLPMANPDGATANARRNAADVDINRDHLALETPEARAIHAALHGWDVHVAIDHHEYSGTGLGNPLPVRLYDYDLTTLFPNHGNVRAPTRAAAEALMYEGIWPAAEAAGYSANEYGERTLAGIPLDHVAGGPDPGIARNSFGLNNVAGLLVETRVDAHPNPFHDAQRRIDIQRVVMDATLRYASENAGQLIQAKRESERLALQDPAREYVEGDIRSALPPAFHVRKDLTELFRHHALDAPLPESDGFVVPLAHERQGLLAAMLHPDSTRAVAAARALDALPNALAPAAAADAKAPIPAGGLLGAVALAGVALAFGRTRKA